MNERIPYCHNPKYHPELAKVLLGFFGERAVMTDANALFAAYHRHPGGNRGYYRQKECEPDEDHVAQVEVIEGVYRNGSCQATCIRAELNHTNGFLYPVKFAVMTIPCRADDQVTLFSNEKPKPATFRITGERLVSATEQIRGAIDASDEGLGALSEDARIVNNWIDTFISVTNLFESGEEPASPVPSKDEMLSFMMDVGQTAQPVYSQA